MSTKNLEIRKIMLPKAEVLIQFVFISLSKLVKSEIHEVLLIRMSSNKEFINQNLELFEMEPVDGKCPSHLQNRYCGITQIRAF